MSATDAKKATAAASETIDELSKKATAATSKTIDKLSKKATAVTEGMSENIEEVFQEAMSCFEESGEEFVETFNRMSHQTIDLF